MFTVTVGADVVTVGGRPTGTGFTPWELAHTGLLVNPVSVSPATEFTFLPSTFQFRDFTTANDGMLWFTGVLGLRGSGRNDTVFEMVPMSSTKASLVPAQTPTPQGLTNPLQLMRVSNGNAWHGSGFTLHGTPQGHLYNGLNFYTCAAGTLLEDFRITGIPGGAGFEPGETFSIGIYRGAGLTIRNGEIDGRDDTGASVAASLIGANFLNGGTFDGLNLHHSNLAAAITAYHCDGPLTYTNLNVHDMKLVGLNFEGNGQTAPCQITIRNCTLKGGATFVPMILDAINTGSSNVYNIYDPIYDGATFRVTIHNTAGQRQRAADVHLWENGVDVSATKLQVLANNPWE